jgi:hypothetical protein
MACMAPMSSVVGMTGAAVPGMGGLAAMARVVTVVGAAVSGMGRVAFVTVMVGMGAFGGTGFVARVVGMTAMGRGACVFAVARVVAFGVVVHVLGVVVRLGWFTVVLVPLMAGVVAVRLVVVLVVRLGIVLDVVVVRSVSGVVHVFPLDDESDIRIMVEAPFPGTLFAAIGPRRRVPILNNTPMGYA